MSPSASDISIWGLANATKDISTTQTPPQPKSCCVVQIGSLTNCLEESILQRRRRLPCCLWHGPLRVMGSVISYQSLSYEQRHVLGAVSGVFDLEPNFKLPRPLP